MGKKNTSKEKSTYVIVLVVVGWDNETIRKPLAVTNDWNGWLNRFGEIDECYEIYEADKNGRLILKGSDYWA